MSKIANLAALAIQSHWDRSVSVPDPRTFSVDQISPSASLKSLPDVVARSRDLTRQITAVSSSEGYDQFARLQRCKFLKTKRFPAN
jgi:hypothetical protein